MVLRKENYYLWEKLYDQTGTLWTTMGFCKIGKLWNLQNTTTCGTHAKPPGYMPHVTPGEKYLEISP